LSSAREIESTRQSAPAELSMLIALASVERDRGRPDRARPFATLAVERATATHDSIGQMDALTELGNVMHAEGLAFDATSKYREALEVARQLDHQRGELLLLEKLLMLSPLSSEKHELLLRAQRLATELGDKKALDRLSQLAFS